MLVPLAFMPLMIKKPSRIILLIPFILLNLMSDYTYQHNINFQYTYGSAAFLFYLMILNYQDMKPVSDVRFLPLQQPLRYLCLCAIHIIEQAVTKATKLTKTAVQLI